MNEILTWEDLNKIEIEDYDRVNGINNSYTNLRLFGYEKDEAIVTLYRDRHSWCPYCQKIWLWLEFKRIPYKVKKINMFCYGQKEKWYLMKVKSGKLPAVEYKDKIIIESDNIISFLENEFGSLGSYIQSNSLLEIRELEREIFRSWCNWLCRDTFNFIDKTLRKKRFQEALLKFENLLSTSEIGFIDPSLSHHGEIEPGTGDIIFIPYMERMNASLAYYKGFNLREKFPYINNWLTKFEDCSIYRGTQGDFHTHSHDLPPQMGGCYIEENNNQIYFSELINNGQGLGNLELNKDFDLNYYAKFALKRVLKHKENIIRANPYEKKLFDESLRSALIYMIDGQICVTNNINVKALKYLKNRISVPRDMPLISARLLRQSLSKIESFSPDSDIDPIPTKHRYDQDPKLFKMY